MTLAGFIRVGRDTMQDRVHAELRAALIIGRVDPGEVLTIQGLAETFGTSTLPAREALSRLVAEHALELQANGSARVPALSRERLADLRRSRKLIEGAAAALAAAEWRPSCTAALRALLSAEPVSTRTDDAYPSLERNRAFHFVIYEAAGSPTLVRAIESLWLQFGPYVRALVGLLTPEFGPGTQHHLAVADALDRGDAAAARRAVEADIDAVCDLLETSGLLDRAAAPADKRRRTRAA